MTGALRAVRSLSPADDIDGFDSGIEELDRWLRSSARVAAAAGTAASYVLCRGERVVGYYALAMSAVGHERAPSRLRRGMPDPVPVVLLARLALDRTVVDSINDDATRFYQHFGFHPLDEARLWRRISDIESSLDE